MQAGKEHAALLDLIRWIDQNTSGLTFEVDERKKLVLGCLDLVLEHQAAIALLHASELYGSALSLLRVLTEALVRGMWLLHCASDQDLKNFKKGRLDKTFGSLIAEVEAAVGDSLAVLTGFKKSAWASLNSFTHTGFQQVSRRQKAGRVEANFSDEDLAKALRISGALGMIAAGQLVGLSGNEELIPKYFERMKIYARTTC